MHTTSQDDWQQVVDFIRSQKWPVSYSEDGEPVSMPAAVPDIFARTGHVAVLWRITPAHGINLNCHFFTPEEIEFDLATWEIVGQFELDVVADFARAIGRVTDKPAIVCYENSPDASIMSYDPTTDAVTLPAPGDA